VAVAQTDGKAEVATWKATAKPQFATINYPKTTKDRNATTKALIPIMKATKADGKNSSIKHRTCSCQEPD
jgi:hypothetical protein